MEIHITERGDALYCDYSFHPMSDPIPHTIEEVGDNLDRWRLLNVGPFDKLGIHIDDTMYILREMIPIDDTFSRFLIDSNAKSIFAIISFNRIWF